MRALVIIPTYNEAENIRPLIDGIFASAKAAGITGNLIEILVVDDNSPDQTGKIADEIVRQNSLCHVLHREGKQGLGTAYIAGFKWGMERSFDSFIEMDADFSHDPSYIPAMLKTLEKSDVAVGSRYVLGGGTRNWGLGRRLLSRGGSLYARLILGAPIRDFTGGFNGWKRRVLEAVDLHTLRSDGYSFQIELKYRAFRQGFKIEEFPIIFADRTVGQSKMNRRIVLEALGRIWGFRLQAPQIKVSKEASRFI